MGGDGPHTQNPREGNEMPANIDTVERLMKERGLTQARLAERANVSAKTISRILTGVGNTNKTSMERVAAALDTTPEGLAVPLDDAERRESDKQLKEANFHRTSFYLRGTTTLNYALVEERYGLSAMAVIDAAPALLTLLAEMSLAERRRRLATYKDAFDAAAEMAPKHLLRVRGAWTDFDNACCDEEEALEKHDLSGGSISADGWVEGDDDTGDLFVAFLRHLSEGIDAEVLEFPGGTAASIDSRILQGDLSRLTNSDDWATFALEHRHARIRDIPVELRGNDRAIERAAWLVAQVPEAARKAREDWLADLDVTEFEI